MIKVSNSSSLKTTVIIASGSVISSCEIPSEGLNSTGCGVSCGSVNFQINFYLDYCLRSTLIATLPHFDRVSIELDPLVMGHREPALVASLWSIHGLQQPQPAPTEEQRQSASEHERGMGKMHLRTSPLLVNTCESPNAWEVRRVRAKETKNETKNLNYQARNCGEL